jgi:RluA family pseudouridine synthase
MLIEENILYVDSSILVVNKPPGLRTIPDGYLQNIENLQSLLKSKFPTLYTVHRLDKDTSGLIVFGLNKESHRNLNIQFEKRSVQKIYHAIVHNIPEWNEYLIDLPLLINGDRKHRTKIHQSGKKAQTLIKKNRGNGLTNLSHLEAIPKTGYTHQIRAHLSHIGHSIFGDKLYSFNLTEDQKLINSSAKRMLLHAASIEFIHPESNEVIRFSSEIPFNLEEI